MCCQLPTVKLPDWTLKNTPPPLGQRAPLRGRLFSPQQHRHFAFCHKIGGNRKWHQEPFAHFTQETLPRPMLYTAVDDLGEQKGTLSSFSTLPLLFLCLLQHIILHQMRARKALSPVIFLGSLYKRTQPAGRTRLTACQLDHSDTGYFASYLEGIVR